MICRARRKQTAWHDATRRSIHEFKTVATYADNYLGNKTVQQRCPSKTLPVIEEVANDKTAPWYFICFYDSIEQCVLTVAVNKWTFVIVPPMRSQIWLYLLQCWVGVCAATFTLHIVLVKRVATGSWFCRTSAWLRTDRWQYNLIGSRCCG